MTAAEKIATSWCEVLLSEQIARFDEILSNSNPERMLPEFSAAARIFQKLTREEQMALLQFFRVVAADSASRILGSLDGSSGIADIEKSFAVKYDGSDLTGKLQDSFLAAVEDSGWL